MFKVKITVQKAKKRRCSCGCGLVIGNTEPTLEISMNKQLQTIEECITLIESIEKEVSVLSKNSPICTTCGTCCQNAPEVSDKEIAYFERVYHVQPLLYRKIAPGKNCLYGGKSLFKCSFSINERPLQCRLWFCGIHIKDFDSLYNAMAHVLGWTPL